MRMQTHILISASEGPSICPLPHENANTYPDFSSFPSQSNWQSLFFFCFATSKVFFFLYFQSFCSSGNTNCASHKCLKGPFWSTTIKQSNSEQSVDKHFFSKMVYLIVTLIHNVNNLAFAGYIHIKFCNQNQANLMNGPRDPLNAKIQAKARRFPCLTA